MSVLTRKEQKVYAAILLIGFSLVLVVIVLRVSIFSKSETFVDQYGNTVKVESKVYLKE
ncbi:MAG: hypothetical protein QM534_03040 [Sediminibacterium sp.]|nr:hypothetical protein [Sediminibacterium sp.]